MNPSPRVRRSAVTSITIVLRAAICAMILTLGLLPLVALADGDEMAASTSTSSAGLQPLTGAIPVSTPAPGESRVRLRPDGAYQAIPDVHGTTKIIHLVERPAPWTLKPGMTVMANTYNGVVPGPAIVVNQGDTVVIDYVNDGPLPDTVHLHGIHDIPVSMDGVAGISQPMVQPGGHYVYRFVASQPGTFIYHTHGTEAMLDSGLYGAIIVEPAHPLPVERGLAHDFLEVISSWQIQSATESEFTLNGKEYPSTTALDVKRGERFRIRWISISGEEFHTMHTHGHDQEVIARDAQPVGTLDLEDTVLLGPGQRVDVVVHADAQPGTWLVHCHVADHTEDANGMPDGLVTAIHYIGTPNTLGKMYEAMSPMAGMSGTTTTSTHAPLGFASTVWLGAIAGLTIFIGLPIARMRKLSPSVIGVLNALAIGILLYLVVEIAQNAMIPISQAMISWHGGSSAFPVSLIFVFIFGLLLGLVGLGSAATYITKRAAKHAENPLVLSMIIAIGIGAHNFGEGLAIGASASSGATALAVALIVGFALHNATEGFGVVAPVIGRVVPSWTQIGIAGLIAGGPTFLGTIVGYRFNSPLLSVLFLATAAGALIYVIGELWAILKRTGLSPLVTTMMTLGFVVAFATELFLDVNGG
jgi:ZIP family zinc transporter